jgi:REP element-mobilizing transposase RayT
MPHTYSQITVHLVFSTKERRRLITDLLRGRLYPYLAALVNKALLHKHGVRFDEAG